MFAWRGKREFYNEMNRLITKLLIIFVSFLTMNDSSELSLTFLLTKPT